MNKTYNAKITWFNKAKQYGEAELDGGHRVFVSDSENTYEPEEEVRLRFEVNDLDRGFLKAGDLVATYIERLT